jgi:FkbM family methyltransferase
MRHLFTTFFLTIPRLARRLSGGGVFHRVLLTVSLWWFVVSRKLVKKLPDYAVTFYYLKTPFVLHLRYPMDIGVLREIYLDNEYDWMPVDEPKIIIDLGAHYGDTTLYYHIRFPQATIIAVEPSPENYARLVKNVRGIPSIIPIQAAVGDTNGVIDLEVGGSALGYSTVKTSEAGRTVSVPQITLATLLSERRIDKADLIKFDIEGAEFTAFATESARLLSRSFIGEVHTDLVPGSTLASFLERFAGMKSDSTVIAGRGRYLVRIHE